MTDAVERVARALRDADAIWAARKYPELSEEEISHLMVEAASEGSYETLARAAILALREPTPEMVRYCRGASEEAGYARDCAVQWRDMIDAALGDPA